MDIIDFVIQHNAVWKSHNVLNPGKFVDFIAQKFSSCSPNEEKYFETGKHKLKNR